jgi:hypothetical protein
MVTRIRSAFCRRLSTPFLASVHCLAAGQNSVLARQLASAIEAQTAELPVLSSQPESDSGLSGCEIREGNRKELLRQFEDLRFPHGPAFEQDYPKRIQRLTDADGAATLFRLPVNGPAIDARWPMNPYVAGLRQPGPDEHPVILGCFQPGGVASVARNDLRKHILITGDHGSGKTHTALFLLSQLQKAHSQSIPSPAQPDSSPSPASPDITPPVNASLIHSLVIESRTQTYRRFLGSVLPRETPIFVTGHESGVALRFNPFALLEGVSVEAHIHRLHACFVAAWELPVSLQPIILEIVTRLYDDPTWGPDRRWLLNEIYSVKNKNGRAFPSWSDFCQTVKRLLSARMMNAAHESDSLMESAMNRLGSASALERLFETQENILPALFDQTALVELGHLNPQDNALTTYFLLTLLGEYREHQTPALRHVTVIEKPHHLFPAQAHGHAQDGLHAILQHFQYQGEGMIWVESSPEKLSAQARHLADIQIAMVQRHTQSRQTMAETMMLSDTQQEHLAKLTAGQAALYYAGLDHPVFVHIPSLLDHAAMARIGL